jgi:hypothetical protein
MPVNLFGEPLKLFPVFFCEPARFDCIHAGVKIAWPHQFAQTLRLVSGKFGFRTM